jgi:hypothetical protein
LSFRDFTFIRFADLREVGQAAAVSVRGGIFHLVAGRAYELSIAHFQPMGGRVRQYDLEADGEIVTVIGEPSFQISSRYDSVPVALYAAERLDSRETMLVAGPSDSGFGARLRLRLRVVPNKSRKALGAVGPAVVAFAVGLPALAGSALGVSEKILIAALGSALGLVMTFARIPS